MEATPSSTFNFRSLSAWTLRGLTIVAPCVIFFAWYEIIYPENMISVHAKKSKAFAATLDDTSLLILGNSHAVEGVLPNVLNPKAFNLAHPSQTSNYDLALLNFAIDHESPIKAVLLCASPFTLGHSEVSKTEARWICYRYRAAYGIFPENWRMATELKSWNVFFRCNGIFGMRDWLWEKGGAKTTIDDQGGLTHLEGWETTFGSKPPDQQRSEALIRGAQQSALTASPVLESNLRNYEEIAARCQQIGAALAVIFLPVSEPYRTCTHMESLYPSVRSVIQKFANENRCVFRDFSSDPRFTSVDFHDPDHLNRSAATRFSAYLRAEILPQLIKE